MDMKFSFWLPVSWRDTGHRGAAPGMDPRNLSASVAAAHRRAGASTMKTPAGNFHARQPAPRPRGVLDCLDRVDDYVYVC